MGNGLAITSLLLLLLLLPVVARGVSAAASSSEASLIVAIITPSELDSTSTGPFRPDQRIKTETIL